MRSLTEVIKDKYEDPGLQEDFTVGGIKVYTPKTGPAISGSGDLQLPPRIVMDDKNISVVGDMKACAEMCRNVRELDLTKNLVTDWCEVFKILDVIPSLQFLNLTSNSLTHTSLPSNCREKTYPHIQTLALNKTGITWMEVAAVLPCFPSLSELHLSMNQFTHVDLPRNFTHPSVSKLFMNNTNLRDWHDISKLGIAFPNLVSMTIIDSDVDHLPDEEVYKEFSKLSVLNISKANLTSWDEIDNFRRFPQLSSLRITGVPFLEDQEPKARRQQLIARLPNIDMLNGSKVTAMEKEDAERAFIRIFMDSENQPARYRELEAVYGKLDPLVDVDLSVSDSVRLLVKFEDKAEYMDIKLYQTVLQFKKLLQNFTGLPCNETHVDYIEMLDGQQIHGATDMRLSHKTLVTYNFNPGDEIHIFRKNDPVS
ncbi:tubulin-specific chaperone cofactor E-like protein [Mya arenaria]|nr:tubulin-specific chaperone cofactor E-like protein [Mya arenaria]XP_052804257.1 tubulin-specific chaperone cofactor E-like protein [Mya arenaria]XP_052804258.1 tubulin-specific chaperone cofactor E-like protein [Mya arenaria]